MASPNTLILYSTTVSDTGHVRSNNQDSSFAGQRLIAVCDGMGGHAGGDTASTIAVRTLVHIEREPDAPQTVGDVASLLETSVIAAHDAIVGKAKRERKLAGMGTTVTAVCLVEDHWVLAHIGDSRAYLLRGSRLIHATKDHSYVQHLIDTGRITPEQARNHPQKNVVMRVLGDFDIDPRPDISVRKAQMGDRWMLCSDGVCGVLSDDTIAETLQNTADPQECAQRLVAMALKAGSTDNCTAVVADAALPLESSADRARHQMPLVGGAVSSDLKPLAEIVETTVAQAPALREEYASSPAQKAADLMGMAEAEKNEEAAREAEKDDGGEPAARPIAADDDDNDDIDEGETTGVWAAGDLQRRESRPDEENGDEDGDEDDTTDLSERQPEPESEAEEEDPDDEAPTGLVPPIRGEAHGGVDEDDTPTPIAPMPAEPDLKVAAPQKASGDEMINTSEIPVVVTADGTETSDPHDPRVQVGIEATKAAKEAQGKSRVRRRRWIVAAVIVIVLAAIAGAITAVYRWSQSQYYVGEADGYVAIYQGTPTNMFGLSLSHEVYRSKVRVDNLPENSRQQITGGALTAPSYDEANGLLTIVIAQNAAATNGDQHDPSATYTSMPLNTGEPGDSQSGQASETPEPDPSDEGTPLGTAPATASPDASAGGGETR